MHIQLAFPNLSHLQFLESFLLQAFLVFCYDLHELLDYQLINKIKRLIITLILQSFLTFESLSYMILDCGCSKKLNILISTIPMNIHCMILCFSTVFYFDRKIVGCCFPWLQSCIRDNTGIINYS